jgi:hypothetical protein
MSDAHAPNSLAVNTTNGAGPHNIQIFFLSSDGIVLHCLPGFWNPDDLIGEMGLASQLNAVWKNPKLTRAQKNSMFTQMQLDHIKEHSPEMSSRSHLQDFDGSFEISNSKTSDFVPACAKGGTSMSAWGRVSPADLKTTDVVVHERMAVRPFLPFQTFDVAVFSNYGTQQYDKQEFHYDKQVAQMGQRKLYGAVRPQPAHLWGQTQTPDEPAVLSREEQQLARQEEQEKQQLERVFSLDNQQKRSMRTAAMPSVRASVQNYNWNSQPPQTTTTTTNAGTNGGDSSLDAGLVANYYNTLERTKNSQKWASAQGGGHFTGPGAQANGMQIPRFAQQLGGDPRATISRTVRTYSNGIPTRAAVVCAACTTTTPAAIPISMPTLVSRPTAAGTPAYGTPAYWAAVYHTNVANVTAQPSRQASQTVYQVSTIVRGELQNKQIKQPGATAKALQAQRGQLASYASPKQEEMHAVAQTLVVGDASH